MLDRTMVTRGAKSRREAVSRYDPPADVRATTLSLLLAETGRAALERKQLSLLQANTEQTDVDLFFSGDLSLLDRPCVAIVGSRKVSDAGRSRTRRLARELSDAGFVVVSGLAEGVDFEAHSAAIDAGGSTIAVIGTPLERVYPAKHSDLQTAIYEDHLLVSMFHPGERTYPSSFPKRNRLMAAITDATIIVEASDTSGTLHQAAECASLKRWLFITQSLAENKNLEWPRKFIGKPKISVFSSTQTIIDAVIAEREERES